MVMQSRKPSQAPPNITLPPDARKKGLIFPTSEGVDHEGHFARASQNALFVYAFSPPKYPRHTMLRQCTPILPLCQ